jgi:hypothetical protein
MQKNYRFEILAFLYSRRDAPVNINPFIKQMAEEGVFSASYFIIQLEAMQTNDLICIEKNGAQMMTRILPEGTSEYKRLKLRCISYNRNT